MGNNMRHFNIVQIFVTLQSDIIVPIIFQSQKQLSFIEDFQTNTLRASSLSASNKMQSNKTNKHSHSTIKITQKKVA
jgi:hypothetical protein